MPNTSTYFFFNDTGDTEKGKSIKVTRKVLPEKSNLAMDQAAAMPNTVLSGTAMAATVSDSRTAARLSGSTMASQKAVKPLANASVNTSTSGNSSTMAIKQIATAPSSSLSHSGSSVGLAKERRREPERSLKKIICV